MAVNIAGEIEKEYGRIIFDDPVIHFEYNIIKFEEKIIFDQKLYFIISLIALIIVILILKMDVLTIFFSVALLYNLYSLTASLDVVIIDFFKKEIEISNKFPPANYLRRVLKRPSVIMFQDIIEFKNYLRLSSWIKERRNVLGIRNYHFTPIKIAKFRFERDARRLGELLQHYIVGKPAINK